MNDRMRKLLRLALLGIFLFSTAMLAMQLLDKKTGEDAYQDARAVAVGNPAPETSPETAPQLQETQVSSDLWYPEPIGEDENLEKLEELDIEALQQVNPDVLGWIYIPGTKIDYPLLQGEDNDFYLEHTWQKQKNAVGSIFLEYQNSPGFSDFNTIVYGHNMKDGSMFAAVSKLVSQWHFDQSPYVYIVLPEGILRYELFSAYKAPVDSKAYGLSFRQRKTREAFIAYALENSQVECGIVPQVTDRILTLSTCTGMGYSNRWVAHGRLKMLKVGG